MTNITTLRPGEHFMFKNFEWVCLDPNHPDGGVLAIMAKPWANNMKFYSGKENEDERGNWNNYRTSNVHKELLLNIGPALGRENLLMHKVDLVADNGDRSYGTVNDKVFLITCDEYRKYRGYIPQYHDWVWTATPWYCGDKDTDTDCADDVRCVAMPGWLCSEAACYGHSVAPACILNPAALNLRQSMAIVEEVSE